MKVIKTFLNALFCYGALLKNLLFKKKGGYDET